MFIQRALDLCNLMKKKSFFLFGPRATGKSSLIKALFSSNTPILNLLRSDLYMRLNNNPSELESIIQSYDPEPSIVVIDEIQRIPMLLNEVHRLIEDTDIKFLMTGSSGRKLKNHSVNLLGGRAWKSELFPLVSDEIPEFNLERYLQYGGLPPVYLSNDPQEELHAYVSAYLREEIQAEAFVRKIPAFSRFLTVAALTSGSILNFSSLSNDTGIPAATIREYYHILEDTFLGFMVPAWTKSLKRKPASTAKFYLFDLGVKNTLADIKSMPPQSDLYGNNFEHFIALELRAYISYRRLHCDLSHWRTQQGHEVDFVVGDDVAIEVKSAHQISNKHLKGLKLLAEEKICKRYFLVSHDTVSRKINDIEILPWQEFLSRLWSDQIFV